jgi:hypothetical protein
MKHNAAATHTILPYRHPLHRMWVFDDARVGLNAEPFIAGADTIIDNLVKNIPDAESGFRLLFSAEPFEEFTHELTWLRTDGFKGNWYRSEELGLDGWLCPALLLYYPEAPKHLFVKTEPLAA